jgi:dihydroorotate dehydrogenase electron transfer subunit
VNAPARVRATVTATRREARYTVLTLDAGAGWPRSEPGQFVMIGQPGRLDPLLPRPFSIYGRDGDRIEILVAEVGKGSRLVARLLPGDPLDVLGPLGTAFPPPDGGPVLLVGGGVGIAPLRCWLQAWPAARAGSVIVFGGRDAASVYAPPDPPRRVLLTTDDGSTGLAGTALDGVADVLRGDDPSRWTVLACGPDAMLRALARAWGGRVAGIWASIEAHMACGMGACLGCVVPDGRGGYLRLCQEGPVIGGDTLLSRYRDA